jgi:RNA polymerase-binding transcription factor DksA
MDHIHKQIQSRLLTERQLILDHLELLQDPSPGESLVEQRYLLQAQGKLARILRALGRLEKGMYGWCLSCHQPIGPARLDALPEAEFCLSCRSQLEHRMLNPGSLPHPYAV